ncbi:MAG: glycosyltransferase family 4 protein [candidate division NC10 bacterium]|nr:glycosyltransferase family 4 protein [candidate division NC10 bacterium]
MDKVRICRVIARLNIGGPAQHTIFLTAGLDPSRYESILVTGREGKAEGNMRDLAEAKGVRLIYIPELGREISPGHDLVAFYNLYRLFREKRPDIVHTHTAKAGALGRLAAKLAGIPVILHTFHGHVLRGYYGPLKTNIFINIERFLARITTCVVTLSEGQRQEILGFGIGRPDQVMIVPLGLELERFFNCHSRTGELKRELGLEAGARLVGIIARLVPIKGHHFFLEAARRVASLVPSARFLVIGDGELRADLEAMARDVGISDRVCFLGWRLDLERVYADLDLLVLSSLNEGTPVSVIEAMAASVPVVATAVGGVKDLMEDGKTGILVPPGDIRSLAEAMVQLLEDEDKARSLAEVARRFIYPRYDTKNLITEMDRLYQRLLAESDRL